MSYTPNTFLNDGSHIVYDEPVIMPNSTTNIYLKHDNCSNVYAYTQPGLTGIPISDFVVIADSTSQWRTYIQFGSTAMGVYHGQIIYITYSSSGDQADSRKLNAIEQTLSTLSNQIDTLTTNASVALSIVSVSPANNSTGASTVGSISFVANKWLDDITANPNCIQVYSDSARQNAIAGIIAQSGNKSYSWTPTSNLNNSSLVYPIISSLVAVDATISATPYTWSFQTASDTPPYTVDSVTVTGYSQTGATVTALKTTIPTYWDADDPTATITFNVYLDASTTPYGNYTWSQISSGIVVTGQSWTIATNHTVTVKTKAITGSKTEYSTGVVSSIFTIPSHTVPTAPTLGTPTMGDTTASIVVSGTSTFYDGATLSTYNKYYRVTSVGGTWTSAGTGTSPLSYTGLTNGIGYDFCAETVDNQGGTSAKSAVVTGTPTAIPSFAPSNDRTATRYVSNPVVSHDLGNVVQVGNYLYGANFVSTACTLYRMNLDYSGLTTIGTLFTLSSSSPFESGGGSPYLFMDTLDANKWKCVFIGIGTTTGYLPYVAVGTNDITVAMTVNSTALVARGTNANTDFDYTNIQHPSIFIDGSNYYLWYSGYNSIYNTISNLALGLASGSSLGSLAKQGRKLQVSGYGIGSEVSVGGIYKYTNNIFYYAMHIYGDYSDIIIYSTTVANPTENSGFTRVGTNTYWIRKTGSGAETTRIYSPSIIPTSDRYKIFYQAINGGTIVMNEADMT